MSNETPSVLVQQLRVRLTGITDYVRDCERRVSMGEIVDMGGLDANVAEICQQVQSLPAEEGQSLEDMMLKLIESLNQLSKTFEKLSQSMASKKDDIS